MLAFYSVMNTGNEVWPLWSLWKCLWNDYKVTCSNPATSENTKSKF